MSVATSLTINDATNKVWFLVTALFDQRISIGDMLADREFERWTIAICKRILRKFERPMNACFHECYEAADLLVDIDCNLLGNKNPITRERTPDATCFKRYIYTVGTNIVLSKLRRQPVFEEILCDSEQVGSDPDRELFWREFIRFTNRHSKTRGRAIVLRSRGYSITAISEMLDCSPAMVQKHIHAAVKGFVKHQKGGDEGRV